MGSISSALTFGRGQLDPNGDVVDPKTGFTRREEKQLKETWDKYVRGDLIGVGVMAMMKLLAKHREIHDMFPEFKDTPLEELEGSRKFHVHCQMIMSTLNHAVDAFLAGDVELFATILNMTGEKHAKRGVLGRHFESVQEPLLESLKQKMGAQWPEVAKLWVRAVEKMMSMIIDSLNDFRNDSEN